MTQEITRPDRLMFDIDMNSLDGDQIGTLLTSATDPFIALMFPPSPGDAVRVRDEDGGVYVASVDEVDDIWVGVTINWDSRTVLPHMSYGHSTFEFAATKPATGPREVVAV